MGEPKFRAQQVHDWLWKIGASTYEEMTNLSKSLREKLEKQFVLHGIKLDILQRSSDGTLKLGFRLHDDHLIEGVLIPSGKRMTACISSQVGCSLSCTFCATGALKMKRNLEAGEIFDQVVMIHKLARENYDLPLSNIVLMGMGEPLLNYRNVMRAMDMVTLPEGLGMSPQRITLSTAGIAKQIKKLADDGARFNLALSLHSANDKSRSEIMPINESNDLDSLVDALNYFHEKTNNRITLEYCVINDINDDPKEAQELVAFARRVVCKVNLIEYNPIATAEFRKSSMQKMERFAAYLQRNRVIATIRKSRGKDIDAACGQLANVQQED
jgi:23S rRNA (adenine2503-C2)-methyltransferase